jgi:hypothetical protein
MYWARRIAWSEIYKDLKLRIEQNYVPINIPSIEVRKFDTTLVPTRIVDYRVRSPQASVAMAPQ